MAKTPKLVRGKKSLPTTATSAGKHDVIVEMTDTAPMTRREGREENGSTDSFVREEEEREGGEGEGARAMSSAPKFCLDIWLGLPQQQEINVGVLLQMESSCRHKRFYEQLPGKMRKVVSPLFFRWNEGGGIRWRIK